MIGLIEQRFLEIVLEVCFGTLNVARLQEVPKSFAVRPVVLRRFRPSFCTKTLVEVIGSRPVDMVARVVAGWLWAGTGPQPPSHHAGYHVHRARADNLDQGLRAERGAETTKDYGSYGEALRHFLKACNIQSAEAHFKDDLEKSLFDEADHGG